MPDNSTLPATGDVIATDEIGGVKYQRVKLVLGADGVNEGDVASGNRLPVQAATLPLPTGASTETTLAALKASVDALSAKVTTANTGAIAGTVALDAPTLAALETISVAGTVSISAASLPLPSGAATQTTLAALNVIAAAVQAAVEAINTKTTAVNTGAIAGTVALDAPTLAALESITASTGGLTDTQMRAAPIPTEEATTGTHYQPGYDIASGVGQGGGLRTDPDGNLVARSQVLTDELGYRANFANTSLAVSIGTATFTNGGRTVTGTGFIAADMRSDDYCKLNADAESAWTQIESLDSDTQITLLQPYSGTGGTGAASRAILKPVTGSGGAISVASGVCTMTSGTTTNAITEVERDVDWLPLVKQSGVAVSQRIVNQGVYVGFYDESAPTAPKWFAWFLLDGTTNTTVKCQSARNPTTAPSAAEIEETVVTLPNGATTATSRRFRPEVLGDRVNFMIDGVLVATHYRAMPGPGDLLTSTVRILNGAVAPASSTTVTVDFDTVKNHNKLEVGLLSDAEQVVAAQPAAQMFTYSVAGVILINTDLMVIDCSQLRSLSVQCASMGGSGVVTPAWSNDGVNWITATWMSEAGATSTTLNSAVMRTTSVRGRFFRLRLTTATTAGTTTFSVAGFQTDLTPAIATQPVSGTVTANIGTGSIAAGSNVIGDVGVMYRTSSTGTAALVSVLSPAAPAVGTIKASAGRLLGWQLQNSSASLRSVKVFAVAAPTLGTTAAAFEIDIPAGGRSEFRLEGGIIIATAATFSVTSAKGLTDNTSTGLALNDVSGAFYFA